MVPHLTGESLFFSKLGTRQCHIRSENDELQSHVGCVTLQPCHGTTPCILTGMIKKMMYLPLQIRRLDADKFHALSYRHLLRYVSLHRVPSAHRVASVVFTLLSSHLSSPERWWGEVSFILPAWCTSRWLGKFWKEKERICAVHTVRHLAVEVSFTRMFDYHGLLKSKL